MMSNRYLVPVRIDCGTGNCTTGTGTYEKQTVDFSRKQNNWVVPVPGTWYCTPAFYVPEYPSPIGIT